MKWLWLALPVLILDRLSKELAEQMLWHQPVAVFPGLNLVLAYNPGAAWGILSEAGSWQTWFLRASSALVCLVLLVWLWRLPERQKLLGSALALVLGGAVGNLWDRCWSGFVVDFIDFYWGSMHWPTFNVADMAITLGAFLFLLDSWRGAKRQA